MNPSRPTHRRLSASDGPKRQSSLQHVLLGLMLCLISATTGCAAKKNPAQPNPLACGLGNCPGALIGCTFSGDCRATLACNKKCSELAKDTAGEQACHLLCQVEEGKDSNCYRKVVQCFADNRCLPRAEEGKDGICPVTAANQSSVIKVGSLAELTGTWREVRGRNCGRPNSKWQGGYDKLKCRSSSWVMHKDSIWYHTSFAGTAGEQGVLPYLIAKPGIAADGGLEVHYTNPPLTPQDERWYVLSRPDPDWIAYTYCGQTPAGRYAGVNVMTRTGTLSGDAIPEPIADAFREDLARFGLSWDQFCSIDHAGCTPTQAKKDLIEHLSEQSK